MAKPLFWLTLMRADGGDLLEDELKRQKSSRTTVKLQLLCWGKLMQVVCGSAGAVTSGHQDGGEKSNSTHSLHTPLNFSVMMDALRLIEGKMIEASDYCFTVYCVSDEW